MTLLELEIIVLSSMEEIFEIVRESKMAELMLDMLMNSVRMFCAKAEDKLTMIKLFKY